MSTEKESPSPSGTMIAVLYGLIIYHNCFREQDHISWWWFIGVPLLYFACWIPLAILCVILREWSERR